MRTFLVFMLLSLATFTVNAQTKRSTFHEVVQGETKYGISTQYNITIEELEKFNPDIKEGLRPGMKLYIPQSTKSKAPPRDTSKYVYVTVQPKQTLYSLSKDYGLSYEEIKALNPGIEDGLQPGQVLKFPKNAKPEPEEVFEPEPGYVYHTVKKGETAYSLSKRFDTSLDSLYLLNPSAKDALNIGQRLKFVDKNKKPTQVTEPKPENGLNTDAEETGFAPNDEAYFLYKVKLGDTFYSIEQKYDVERERLIALNPELKEGLKIGRYIILPSLAKKQDAAFLDQLFSEVEAKDTLIQEVKEFDLGDNAVDLDTVVADITKTYRIGVMLPFFAPTFKDTSINLQFEKRSKVALDFYNGFLLAADSLNKMGMNLEIRVYDTRNSAVTVEDKINELKKTQPDLIVGPLYKSHVEKVATEFQEQETPVVSPLSSTVSVKGHPNLIQCITSNDAYAASVADIINSTDTVKHIIFAHTGANDELEILKQIRARVAATDDNISFAEIIGTEDNNNTLERSAVSASRKEGHRNLFVSLSKNQVLLADLVNQLFSIRDTAVRLIAPANIMEISTLDYKYLNAINLRMPDDHIMARETQDAFNAKYVAKYELLPSKYAMQGYDVGLFFLNRLWKYGPYLQQSLGTPEELNFTGFEFSKSEGNGYQNQFMYTTALINYRLVRLNN